MSISKANMDKTVSFLIKRDTLFMRDASGYFSNIRLNSSTDTPLHLRI